MRQKKPRDDRGVTLRSAEHHSEVRISVTAVHFFFSQNWEAFSRKNWEAALLMARAAALAALAVASEAFMPPVIPGFCHHSQPARIVCAFMARVIRALCFV